MQRLPAILTFCGALAAGTANSQPPAIQRLDVEIGRAKEKRDLLRSHLKAVRESHLRYQIWLKEQFKQAKFEDAVQAARVQQAAVIQRQMTLAGIHPTVGAVVNRRGRVVGFTSGAYIDPTERAAGLLLGKRLTDKAFDEYSAWRQNIGNNLAAARSKLFEYGRVKAQLDRDVTKLGRWIDAAERTKKKLKESGKLPEPEYAAKLPPGVLLAMTFDKPTTRGESLMVVQDLSGWGHHGLCDGCELTKGIVGDALRLSGKPRQFRTLLDQKDVQAVAVWINGDSFDKSQSLIRGNDRAFAAEFVEGDRLQFTLAGTDGKGRTVSLPHGMTAGKWHHLAFVLDRKQRRFVVYVDGAQKAAVTLRTGIPVPDAFLNLSDDKPGLSGMVDELVVFRYPLTAEQVKTVYEMGKNGESLSTKRK